MKTLYTIAFLLLLILGSCTSQLHTGAEYDDLYFSSSDYEEPASAQSSAERVASIEQDEQYYDNIYAGDTLVAPDYNGEVNYDEAFVYDNNVYSDGGYNYYDGVSYSGRLISGLTFVSTSEAGKPSPGSKPAAFTYEMGKDGLLKGLQKALKEMKAGEKRVLVIPPSLAYGEKSGFYGKDIPGQKRFVISPGETLILEVTLNKINTEAR